MERIKYQTAIFPINSRKRHDLKDHAVSCCLLPVSPDPDKKTERLSRKLFPSALSGIDCGAVHVQRVAVKGDVRRIPAEGGDKGVAGQRPGAGAVEAHIHCPDFGRDGIVSGIHDFTTDGTGKGTAVGEVQCQDGVAAYEDRSAEFLPVCIERRDVACTAPAVVTDGEENAGCVFVTDLHIGQVDDRVCIGHVEYMTVSAGEGTTRHGE